MSHHIKTAEGYDVRVPSQGQVDFATVGGALGIASFAGLNAGNLLGGMGWGNNCNGGWGRNVPVMPICSEDHCVTRYDLGMEQKLAAKDSEIALLKANTYNDAKTLELYRYVDSKFNSIEARLAGSLCCFPRSLPFSWKQPFGISSFLCCSRSAF
jgi:hypothetical protein